MPTFDPLLVQRHIERARPHFDQHSALFDETAAQLEERLSEVKQGFNKALDLSPFPFLKSGTKVLSVEAHLVSEQERIAAETGAYDLAVSNLGLQSINDVPGILAQIRSTLTPNGLFLSALIGGRSLHELRHCLLDAEIELTGGASPRIAPMIDLETAAHLIRSAGFKLPVVDIDTVTLLYSDMFALMRDLRGMGQTNALSDRLRHFTRRAIFERAADLYVERYTSPEGYLQATFDIIYLHGWT